MRTGAVFADPELRVKWYELPGEVAGVAAEVRKIEADRGEYAVRSGVARS